jgi:hypothetical protein
MHPRYDAHAARVQRRTPSSHARLSAPLIRKNLASLATEYAESMFSRSKLYWSSIVKREVRTSRSVYLRSSRFIGGGASGGDGRSGGPGRVPVDSALIRCKSRQRTGSRCYPKIGGKFMAVRSPSSFAPHCAGRSARSAVDSTAQRSRSAVDFDRSAVVFDRSAVDFHTAVRSFLTALRSLTTAVRESCAVD